MVPGIHQTDIIPLDTALTAAADIVSRYGIAALHSQLAAARDTAEHDDLMVAVVGRFKAGKSSFLNHLAGLDILPTGAVPVTAVVTELRYGQHLRARVHHLDGRITEIPPAQLSAYATEKENAGNAKQVDRIHVEIPELCAYRGLRFADTPGLDSSFAYNTETSLRWLPNAGMALVAIGVDPPLSARDIELIRTLARYTPEIAILLTKADLLSSSDLDEVIGFVRAQLAAHLAASPTVFPYSVKPGFEQFRRPLESLLRATVERLPKARQAVAAHKLGTLLDECADFLTLGLRAAETAESERRELERQITAEDQTLSTIQLVVERATAQARASADARLDEYRSKMECDLLEAFEREFPGWTGGLSSMLSRFEAWLAGALRTSLAGISQGERDSLRAPVERVRAGVAATLQQFRDRLSGRTLHAFGVPLRTTETDLAVADPGAADIRIGRIFDRNWELLSPVLPMWAIRAAVRRHFARVIPYAVYQNISRLGSQWEQTTVRALRQIENEARRRHAGLIATVRHLIETGGDQSTAEIRADLERIRQLRNAIGGLP